MQINNNYQPNFRAGKIDNYGLKALGKRLKGEQINKFVDRFKSRHQGSEYKITLGSVPQQEGRLDAMITYGKKHFRYLEESILSSCIFNPKNFMKKINKQIEKDLASIATKGYLI